MFQGCQQPFCRTEYNNNHNIKNNKHRRPSLTTHSQASPKHCTYAEVLVNQPPCCPIVAADTNHHYFVVRPARSTHTTTITSAGRRGRHTTPLPVICQRSRHTPPPSPVRCPASAADNNNTTRAVFRRRQERCTDAHICRPFTSVHVVCV